MICLRFTRGKGVRNLLIIVGGVIGIIVMIIYISICNRQSYSPNHAVVGFYIFLAITLLFSTIHLAKGMNDIKEEINITVIEELTRGVDYKAYGDSIGE